VQQSIYQEIGSAKSRPGNSKIKPHQHYIILDDIEEYFDSTFRNLYLVDGVTELTKDDIEIILQ
jgi:hypothetical protein